MEALVCPGHPSHSVIEECEVSSLWEAFIHPTHLLNTLHVLGPILGVGNNLLAKWTKIPALSGVQ